jgi:hypothetical protein
MKQCVAGVGIIAAAACGCCWASSAGVAAGAALPGFISELARTQM